MLDLLQRLFTNKAFLLVTLVSAFCVNTVTAQTTPVKVRISFLSSTAVGIQINLNEPADSWSFRNAVAGALGLGERVEQFQAKNREREVGVRKLAAGEFRCDSPAESVSYVVQIAPGRPGDFAHVSWLMDETGVLMLGDLLPESVIRAHVELDLPEGWTVGSSLRADARNSFVVDQAERQVFLIGKDLHEASRTIQGMDVQIVASGRWKFNDKNVLTSAGKVLEYYVRLTGFKLANGSTIFIAPMPSSDSSAEWKAETRGATVTLLLNRNARIENWLPQLGVIFTHELLHLWVPNSLGLAGDYDWFFEGFTVYVALEAALRLKLIGFAEFLRTIGRVYDSYLSYEDNQSLLEASESRWTSTSSVVYDKGMLVALLYDLTLRQESRGQKSLADRYRFLFGANQSGLGNGNDVIIQTLNVSPVTEIITKSYIESKKRIELERLLPTFGIDVQVGTADTHLNVRKPLTDEQRELLRSLGYKK